jgi:hypothetical protein
MSGTTTRTAHAGLNFIVDQHDAPLIAQLSQVLVKLRGGHAHAGHRLNWLQHDSRDAFVGEGPYGTDVVPLRFEVSRNIRLANLAILAQESGAD